MPFPSKLKPTFEQPIYQLREDGLSCKPLSFIHLGGPEKFSMNLIYRLMGDTDWWIKLGKKAAAEPGTYTIERIEADIRKRYGSAAEEVAPLLHIVKIALEAKNDPNNLGKRVLLLITLLSCRRGSRNKGQATPGPTDKSRVISDYGGHSIEQEFRAALEKKEDVLIVRTTSDLYVCCNADQPETVAQNVKDKVAVKSLQADFCPVLTAEAKNAVSLVVNAILGGLLNSGFEIIVHPSGWAAQDIFGLSQGSVNRVLVGANSEPGAPRGYSGPFVDFSFRSRLPIFITHHLTHLLRFVPAEIVRSLKLDETAAETLLRQLELSQSGQLLLLALLHLFANRAAFNLTEKQTFETVSAGQAYEIMRDWTPDYGQLSAIEIGETIGVDLYAVKSLGDVVQATWRHLFVAGARTGLAGFSAVNDATRRAIEANPAHWRHPSHRLPTPTGQPLRYFHRTGNHECIIEISYLLPSAYGAAAWIHYSHCPESQNGLRFSICDVRSQPEYAAAGTPPALYNYAFEVQRKKMAADPEGNVYQANGVPHGESPAVFVPQSRREWDLVMRPLGDAEKANFGIIACGAALKEGGICNQILELNIDRPTSSVLYLPKLCKGPKSHVTSYDTIQHYHISSPQDIHPIITDKSTSGPKSKKWIRAADSHLYELQTHGKWKPVLSYAVQKAEQARDAQAAQEAADLAREEEDAAFGHDLRFPLAVESALLELDAQIDSFGPSGTPGTLPVAACAAQHEAPYLSTAEGQAMARELRGLTQDLKDVVSEFGL